MCSLEPRFSLNAAISLLLFLLRRGGLRAYTRLNRLNPA
jgi:hypothetical protein